MSDDPSDAFANTLDHLDSPFGSRYRLIATLGSGAMGTVHKVLDTELDEIVALKVLRPELASDPRAALRLRREVKLARRVTHQNVARVFDLQVQDDHVHITMEFVDGTSLQEELEVDRQMTPARVVELACQICDGLQAAHSAGVVHRDLKPDNVMVTRDGVVKLADFGIATTVREDTGGEFVGTPYYVAPEQARGQPVDGRADIYALGAMMWEMLVGHPPWEGETVMQLVMRRLMEDPPPFPNTVRLPESLEQVVMTCMAREAQDRFVSAAAIQDALKGLEASGKATVVDRTHAANLPTPTNTFVGREVEAEELGQQVLTDRLITLLGPGGTGKTRLALEIGRSTTDKFDESWFVEVAAATSGDEILRIMCSVLDVPMDEARLVSALREKRKVLLILDNLEQAAGPAAEHMARWLELVPSLHVLATSRVRLGIEAEHVFVLAPLSTAQAVALFEARARMVRPGYEVGPAQSTVEQIVERVDRLPLAVEIVAAQMRLFDEEHVLSRLDDRFRALRGGHRDRPARHATMESVLDGSWELLDNAARSALMQLSVFRGGATIEAACEVLDVSTDERWPEELLEQLWDHSLLRFAGDRIELLDLVREYATEKLDDPEPVFARHGATYARLAEQLRRGAARDHARLVAERANLAVACERGIDRGDDEVVASTLTGLLTVDLKLRGQPNLDLYWRALTTSDDAPWRRRIGVLVARALVAHGRDDEARLLLEPAADAEIEPNLRVRASALAALGGIQRRAGEHEEGQRASRDLLTVAQMLADDELQSDAYDMIGAGHWLIGEFDAAERAFERALQLAATDRSEAQGFNNLGLVHADRGEPELAANYFRRALSVHRKSADLVQEAVCLSNLGMALHSLGKEEEASESWLASLRLHQRTGDVRWSSLVRLNLGSQLIDLGELEAARRHLFEALEGFRSLTEPRFEGIVLGTLGLSDARLGDFDVARTRFDVGERLLRDVADAFSLGRLLAKRGQSEAMAGQMEAAARYLDEARDIAAETGVHSGSPLSVLIASLEEMVEGD